MTPACGRPSSPDSRWWCLAGLADQLVVMWVGFLPVAVVPLWQVEQPSVMPACENVAGCQAVVEWQAVAAAWSGGASAGLPVAVVPLWQLSAAAGDLRVVDARRRLPDRRRVAGLAAVAGVRCASGSCRWRCVPLWQVDAAAGDAGVVEVSPASRPWSRGSSRSCCRSGMCVGVLAGGRRAVVAGEAGAGDLRWSTRVAGFQARVRVAGLAAVGGR